jgi:hypothetical protein
MPILGIISSRMMLQIFFLFQQGLGRQNGEMVFLLIALFLGTGNHTVNDSCTILERLFVYYPE